ncbi:hypothetical protein LOC71_07555 [Rhodopirellula sp. JC740]|uniref:Transmembrane protein n=1 Tax=Rhodopirellula halodulae TaxID=2894198 RepID=A0ABS8NEZ0_9BACT|nr:hypothetical protein [Rhodopirellula sp. JC740]MCC9642125.1 hypothetical protein [Rhodopirellula sp. JC740]
MIYFICWVVFLLTLILSVVIVGFKNRKPRPAVAAVPEEMMEDGEAVEMVGEDEFAAEPAGDDFGGGEFAAEGGDDFATFEDEFK